ncbi:hypothetical protein N9N99_03715 [Gammaproteobacteria bacterium]|nr:hypothetical protein [Gammaproteobacteria bacterium]
MFLKIIGSLFGDKKTKESNHDGYSLLYSYLAFLLPGALSIILLPILISTLGVERFSLFTTLFVIGFFLVSLDLGLSASVTRQTSKALSLNDHEYSKKIIISALWLLIFLGLFIFTSSILLNEFYFSRNINLTNVTLNEFKWAFIAMSLGIIPTFGTSALRGALEGRQKFKAASFLRLTSGTVALLIPVILAFFIQQLHYIFLYVTAFRFLIFFIALIKTEKSLQISYRVFYKFFDVKVIKILFGYGLWVSVGHIAGGLITTGIIDRVFLSIFISPEDVLSYNLPRDIITRILLIPVAISILLLPKLVHLNTHKPKAELSNQLFNTYIIQVAPICFLLSSFATELLSYISIDSLSPQASQLFNLLLVGLLVFVPTYILHTNLLACGKPMYSALRHLIQIPFYFLFSYLIARSGKIEFFGYLWIAWCFIDLLMLELISKKFLYRDKINLERYFSLFIVLSAFVIFINFKEEMGSVFQISIVSLSIIMIIVNVYSLLKKKILFEL